MDRAHSLNLHEIKPHHKIQFDDKGHFKEDKDLALFMEQAVNEGATPRSFDGIKRVKPLSKELKEAKYASEQLWLIECMNGYSFILKEIKHNKEPLEEIKRLERARTAHRLQPYVFPRSQDNLQLVFPSRYITYTYRKQQHIMALMPKAKGKRLQSLMEDFERSPDNQQVLKLACKVYYDLGATMAKFYKSFGTLDKTISHKDFHQGNIFYDRNGLISLIDNERMAQTLEEADDISSDLGYLFVTSPFILEWARGGFLKNFPAKKWYQIVLPSFIIGFMRAYEKHERADVFARLVELICAWESKVNENDSRPIRGIIREVLKNMETQLKERKSEAHIAAGNPDLTALVEILIKEKTRALFEKDIFGNTPLHEAAYFGCSDSVALLVAAGCDVSARNDKQETPLFKAEFANHRDIAKLLKKSAATIIEVVKGDILKQNVDVIVNAANPQLAAGGGICEAIFDAAGKEQLKSGCHGYPLIHGVRCPAGDARITDSFKLEAQGVQKIVHAVGPDARIIKDHHQQRALLEMAYTKSLELAAKGGFTSIAFPFISSGIYQVDHQLAAKAAITAARKFVSHHATSLRVIRFVLRNTSDYELFKELLADE